MLSDDTLREGLQSPGFAMKLEEKLKMAEFLSKAGIKRALVSYPSAHISEVRATEQILSKKYFDDTFALGRTLKEDIDLINDTGANISLHLPFRIDSWDDVYENIKYACSLGRKVEVGFVDIDMFSIEEIIKFAVKMEEFGLDTLQLPDTRGMLTPDKMFRIIKTVKEKCKIKVEVHCHNDHGLAIANAISGIGAGADYVDATIFGMGERNGIADSLTIADYIENNGIAHEINRGRLRDAYDYMYDLIIEKIGQNFFVDNFSVYGKNSGIQTAGTHVAFNSIFTEKNYSVNVYTGKTMIKNILGANNIALSDEKLYLVVKMAKDTSVESGKALKAKDIIKIAGEIDEKSH
ncbi:MAG: hypothetical protein QXZ44_06250 [Ferroplasma sp.]